MDSATTFDEPASLVLAALDDATLTVGHAALTDFRAGDGSLFGTVVLYLSHSGQVHPVAHPDPDCALAHTTEGPPVRSELLLAGQGSFQSLGAKRCVEAGCLDGWRQIKARIKVPSELGAAFTMAERLESIANRVWPMTRKTVPVQITDLFVATSPTLENLTRHIEAAQTPTVAAMLTIVAGRLSAAAARAHPVFAEMSVVQLLAAGRATPTDASRKIASDYVFARNTVAALVRDELDAFLAIEGPWMTVRVSRWMPESFERLWLVDSMTAHVPYPLACALLRNPMFGIELGCNEPFFERLVATLLEERRPATSQAASDLVEAAKALAC